MINFAEKVNMRVQAWSCTAFDRQEMASCDFFVKGRDGWCQHILSDQEIKKGGKTVKIVPRAPTGACQCDKAISTKFLQSIQKPK